MSEVQTRHEHDSSHEGPIKTPKQLVAAIFFAFVVPIIVIVMLATYVVAENRPAAGSDGLAAASVTERIRPIGMVEVKDASDPTSMKTGEQVFAAQCAACHATGAAGAPKFGDAAAWGPRVPSGYDSLLNSALHGKGAMGAQGGGDFSDFEIGRAVVYMANQGGAKFSEPTFAPPTASDAATQAADPAAATAVAAATAAMAKAAAPAAATATATAAAPAGAVPALYTQACAVCHAAGVAGAPKLGDKAAWAPRVAQGVDGLTASAIKGKGAMPPRGGSQASDAEIKAVVGYMVQAVH